MQTHAYLNSVENGRDASDPNKQLKVRTIGDARNPLLNY
jgi:hypothetical protein